MKSIFFLFFALFVVSIAAHGHHQQWCDLSIPRVASKNAYYLGTIAKDSDIGNVWQHDVVVVTPSTTAPPPAKDVFAYSTWQDNFNNVDRCAVTAIEFAPRITENGEFALVIQEIDAELIPPCYARCAVNRDLSPSSSDDSGSSDSSSSSHSHGHGNRHMRKTTVRCERSREFTWLTPRSADSIFTLGKIPDNTIFGDNVQSTAWRDPNTNEIVLAETLTTVVPTEHRLYNLGIMGEFVPGNPYSTDFLANAMFNSNSVPAPAFVAAARAAYLAGQVPILTDPNSPPGFPLPVYLYVVPQSKRSDDMDFFEQSAISLSESTRFFHSRM